MEKGHGYQNSCHFCHLLSKYSLQINSLLIYFFKVLFFIFFCWLYWVFVAPRGLSLVAVSRGYSLVELHGLLVAVASPCGAWSLGHVGFSSCGAWAQLPCSLWGLPGPGIEPGFSVLAGRFLTAGSSRKSCTFIPENAFFWISFPLNVVSETSPLKIIPFHGVEEYNIQSGQIFRFKDTIFFSFSANLIFS